MTRQSWLAPGPWAAGFDVQGHRGARAHVVENTWAGIVRGVELGATTIEIDVQLTGVGHVVVWHDAVLDRAVAPGDDAGLRGRAIIDLSLAQVQSVQVGGIPDPKYPRQEPTPGASILTLANVLHRVGAELPGTWVNIEVKLNADDPRTISRRDELVDAVLADIVAARAAERVIVHSFDWWVLRRAAERAPHIVRSALVNVENLAAGPSALGGVSVGDATTAWRMSAVIAGAVEVGAAALCPGYPWLPPGRDTAGLGDDLTVDAEFVEAAHAAGLAVIPWTVNNEADIADLIEAGVDGIVSDVPDLVVRVLATREETRT